MLGGMVERGQGSNKMGNVRMCVEKDRRWREHV